ncbi:unnamed protein product [[Candida] boidinii]|nr:unnamed protein product [[Candida] boidinii]
MTDNNNDNNNDNLLNDHDENSEIKKILNSVNLSNHTAVDHMDIDVEAAVNAVDANHNGSTGIETVTGTDDLDHIRQLSKDNKDVSLIFNDITSLVMDTQNAEVGMDHDKIDKTKDLLHDDPILLNILNGTSNLTTDLALPNTNNNISLSSSPSLKNKAVVLSPTQSLDLPEAILHNPSSNNNTNSNNNIVTNKLNTVNQAPENIQAYAILDFDNFTFYVQTMQILLGRRVEGDTTTDSLDIHLGQTKSISRRHAMIFYNFGNQRFELTVIGRNGAFVDDVFVECGVTLPLKNNNNIQIGETHFKFILPSDESLQIKNKNNRKLINPSDAINLKSSLYKRNSNNNSNDKNRTRTSKSVHKEIIIIIIINTNNC